MIPKKENPYTTVYSIRVDESTKQALSRVPVEEIRKALKCLTYIDFENTEAEILDKFEENLEKMVVIFENV